MKNFRRLAVRLLLIFAVCGVSVSMQSCYNISEVLDECSFEGRSFIAEDSSHRFNWVLDFDFNGGFTVTAYDFHGYRIYNLPQYCGYFRVNGLTKEVYLNFFGGGCATWTYTGIYSPSTIYTPWGTGYLDNLDFRPYYY